MHHKLGLIQKLVPAIIILSLLSACASSPPPSEISQANSINLRLSPAELGESIQVEQRLTVERDHQIDSLDVALQVDPQSINLVGLVLGKRVLSLHFDGTSLTAWRHPMLPEAVRAEDVLENMQLSLWPADAISRQLPSGWHLQEAAQSRFLFYQNRLVIRIDYTERLRWRGTVRLENFAYHYVLTVETAP